MASAYPAVYAEELYAVGFVVGYPLTSGVSRCDVVVEARVSPSGGAAGELLAVLVARGFARYGITGGLRPPEWA